jgi:Leucine-rich repeat (LRR) protein
LEIANLKITDEQLAIARPLIKTYTNLIEINLEDNNLENIEYIQELAKLRKINLQGNKIKTLENSEIFFGCTSLEEIDLSNNNIINFDANYLKNIRETLKILRINNNKQLEAELEDYEEKREKKLSILQ